MSARGLYRALSRTPCLRRRAPSLTPHPAYPTRTYAPTPPRFLPAHPSPSLYLLLSAFTTCRGASLVRSIQSPRFPLTGTASALPPPPSRSSHSLLPRAPPTLPALALAEELLHEHMAAAGSVESVTVMRYANGRSKVRVAADARTRLLSHGATQHLPLRPPQRRPRALPCGLRLTPHAPPAPPPLPPPPLSTLPPTPPHPGLRHCQVRDP